MRFKKTILACGITLLALLSARPARADTSAVAVLSSDKRTLTFVNPKDKTGTYAVSQDGTKYNGTVLSASGAAKDDYMAGDDNRGFKEAKSTVTKIVIKDALAPDDASYYFADFKKLESVEGLDKLTLPEKAAGLFYNDTSLKTVDMSKTDASKTTDISYMFSRNSIGDDAETLKMPDSDSLTAVKLPSFKSVTNAKYAFWSAKSIKSLDVSGLNPDIADLTHAFGQMSDVTDITLPDKFANKADDLSYLFYKDGSLSTLDGDKLDLSNATSARHMIAGAGLTTLNMARWHMSNMTNLEGFAKGSKLTAVDLSNAGISSVNLSSAFAGMDNLAGLNLSGIKKATNVESLVANDTKLTSVNLPFDTSSATDFSYAFQNVGLEELDLSSWDTTNAKSMKMMFTSSSDLSKVTFGSKFKFNNATLPNAKTGDGFTGKWTKETDYSKQTSNNCYSADDLAKLSDVSGTWIWSGKDTRTEFFVVVNGGAADLIKVYRSKGYKNGNGDFEDVDGNKYSGMGYKAVLDGTAPGWSNNSAIKTFNVKYKFKPAGHFDYMFYKLSNLTTINGMEKLDFTNTTTASHMFDGSGMKSLDLTVFDDTNTPMRDLKDVSYFLANMPNLTSVTFAKGNGNPRQEFYTRNATNFSHFFENDTAITSLNFGYWDKEDLGLYTNNATDTSYMFAGMTNLRSISGFQLSAGYFGNVRNAESMFDGTVNLTDLGSYGYGTDRPEHSFAFYHLQNARHMFRNTGLSSLKMQFFHFKNTLTDATGMFDGSKITQLIIGSNNAFNGHGSFQDMSKVDDAYTNRWVRDGKSYTVDEISKLGDLSGTWTDFSGNNSHVYAVIDKDGLTMSFIRSNDTVKLGQADTKLTATNGLDYTGWVYDANGGWVNRLPSEAYDKIKTVKFLTKVKPTSTAYWFNGDRGFRGLVRVTGAQRLDMSEVTSMQRMFNRDKNLVSLDASSWKMPKATNASYMFYDDDSLTSVGDLSGWQTGNIQNTSHMFYDDHSLTSLGDLGSWDMSNNTDMNYMFGDMHNLVTVGDLSKWQTGKVKDTSRMFIDDYKLTTVGDLSKWNVGNVTNMAKMFLLCKDLTNVGNLDNWNVSNVTDMSWMFGHDYKLTTVGDLSKWQTGKVQDTSAMFVSDRELTKVGNLDNWDMSSNTDMSAMFSWCLKLTNVGNLDNWNVSNVTDMGSMFNNCNTLTNVGDLSKWQTGKVKDTSWMFSSDRELTKVGNLSKWDMSSNTDMAGMFNNCNTLTNVGNLDNWNVDNVTNMSAMFNNCYELTNVGDLSKWQTGKVQNTSRMFSYDYKLTKVGNLDNWDMSSNTDMSAMFNDCSNLTSVGNLDNWNVSNVTGMSSMFNDCFNLTNVGNLSKWQTGKVKGTSRMFASDEKLTKVGNLDNWDMSSNTDMSYMFSYCKTLTSVGNLDNWNVGNVTNMRYMFNNCSNLTTLGDLKNWDVRKVTDMSDTFSDMRLLKSLDMSNWSTDSLILDSYMLDGMYRLESISFGPKTKIDANADLDDPYAYGDATWGKWVRTSDNKALSGYDLSAMRATSRPTTWVAKRMSLTVKMRAKDKGRDYYDETLESFDINSSGYSGVVDKTHLTDRINFFTKHAYDMTENNVPDNFDHDAESWHMTYTVDFDRVKSQISMALNNMPGVTSSYVTNFLNGSTDSYNNRSIRAAYGKNSFELNILYKVGSDNLFDNFKYDNSTGTFALNRYRNGTTSYNPLVKSAFIFDKIPHAFKITKMSVQDELSPSATITGGRYSYSNMSHYAGVAVDNINPGDNVVVTIDFETSLSDIINYSKTNNNMITPYFGPSEKDAAGEHVTDMHANGNWGERYDDLQIKNPDVYMLTPVAALVDSDRNETMYYKTKSIFNTWGDKPKDATVNIPNYHWDSTVNGYDNMADGVTSLGWNGSNGMHASRIEYDNGLNWGLLNKKDSHYDSAYENVALQSLQTNNDFNSAYTFINMDHNNYEHLQSLNGNIGKFLDNKQNTSISYEIQAPKTVADQANTVSQTNKFVSIPYATLNVFAQSLNFYHEPIYSYKDWINTALDNPLNQSFKGQVYSINSDENLSEYNNPSAYATKIPNYQESHTSNGGTNWQMDGYRGSVDAINVDRYYGLLSNMDASSGKYVLSAKAGYGISYPFQYTILEYMSHVATKAPKFQAQANNLFDDLYIKDANNENLTFNYKSTVPAVNYEISTGLISPSLAAMVNKVKAVDKTVTHYGYGDTNADYQALNKSERNDVDYLIGYMSTLRGINSMYPVLTQLSFEPQAKVFKNGHQVYADEANGTNGFNRSYIKSDLPQGIYPIRFYGNYGDVKIDVNDWEVKLIGKRLLTKGGDNKNDEISVEGALSGDSTDDVSRLKSRYHLTQDQAEKLHDFLMDNDK